MAPNSTPTRSTKAKASEATTITTMRAKEDPPKWRASRLAKVRKNENKDRKKDRKKVREKERKKVSENERMKEWQKDKMVTKNDRVRKRMRKDRKKER